MRFWDTSALVPLLVAEDATKTVAALYASDSVALVAWTTLVECGSALARAEHDGALSTDEASAALARLDVLAATWHEVEPSNDLRDLARRLLRVHRLRAGDAMQLAAASLAAERRPSSLTFVTLDERLDVAASKEGFPVVRPTPPGVAAAEPPAKRS